MSLLTRSKTAFQAFIESESAGGLVLMVSAVAGLVLANSPLAGAYHAILHAKLAGFDVLHWINDGLMTIFFLLVGLEIKREMVEGQLDSWPTRILPCLAALGGMIAPAIVFMIVNRNVASDWRGAPIPAATDIAFALGVLSLFGSRVTESLKVFLTSLAIIDDLGAILIIAVFYSHDLSLPALSLVGATVLALLLLNRFGVMRLSPYLLLGAVLWGAMLFSGIHATLAGVLLAMLIPIGPERSGGRGSSPLHRVEHGLEPWVAFGIIPLFGLANAGVPLNGMGLEKLTEPLALGIILGLFIGKQAGIMLVVWAAIKSGIAEWPRGSTWRQTYGVAVLCGIGFTMSLFIGLLAFPDVERQDIIKLAVLAGSLLSALGGAIVFLSPGGNRLGKARKEEQPTSSAQLP